MMMSTAWLGPLSLMNQAAASPHLLHVTKPPFLHFHHFASFNTVVTQLSGHLSM